MADPDLELPDLSPGETGPQSLPMSSTAATAITSGTPQTAVLAEDKAAIAHFGHPYRETTTAQAQPTLKAPPSPSSTLANAVRNRPAKSQPHGVAPIRDHGSWGEPSDVQPPPLHQIPNVFSAIGGWFGNTNLGSSTQQILGQGLKQHTDAWYRAYNGQRSFEQEYHHKQVMDHSQELESGVKDKLLEAKAILQGDPKDIVSRLHELARRTHDPTLEYKLTSGGAQEAVKYLQQVDQWWQDLNKSNATLIKQQQIDQNQAPAYEAPDSPNLQPPKPVKPDGAADGTADGADPFAPHSLTGEPIIVAPQPDQPAAGGLAPAQQPAAPAAPEAPAVPAGPAPYEIPGEPDTSAPGQEGAAPSISPPSDIGAAQPDAGIQVAEAGMSDVAPSWIKEIPPGIVAQATPPTTQPPDDPYVWAEPPSNLMDPANARTASGRVLRNRDYIRNYALQGIEDPATLDRLAKTQPDVANKANQMANEIRANLRSIATDRHRPGKWMIDAINSQVPGLGDEVKQVANGDRPPPGAAQTYGTRSAHGRLVASLVGKYDPTMLNPIAYQNRAKARQYWSIGKGGDMMLAQGAAYLHGFALLDSLEGLRGTSRYGREFSQYDPPVGGDWLRKYGMYPSVEEGKRVADVIANARVFMNEAEAVLHKGAPTVAGVKTQEEEFDVNRMNVDVLHQHVQTYIDRLRDKMQENMMRFHAGTAQGPDQLERLFQDYVSQGQTPRAVSGRPMIDAIHKMIVNDPSRPNGSAPRAQAPAPVRTLDDVRQLPSGTPFIIPDGPHKGETGYAQ